MQGGCAGISDAAIALTAQARDVTPAMSNASNADATTSRHVDLRHARKVDELLRELRPLARLSGLECGLMAGRCVCAAQLFSCAMDELGLCHVVHPQLLTVAQGLVGDSAA